MTANETAVPAWRSDAAGRLLCVVALGAFAAVVLRTAWVCDDAFITLRTVDNFVNGYGLRWNVAERVQAFTHPLWLMLLTVPYFATHEAFYTVTAVSIAVSLSAACLLAYHGRRAPWSALVGLTALLLSRAFTDYSTSGLENPLTHLLIVVFVVLLADGPMSGRRLLALAFTAALATLNRLDNVLLVAPALALAAFRFGRVRALGVVAAGFAPLVLWEAFSLLYYGAPYPNTALAKLNTGIPAGELVSQGLAYLGNSIRSDPLTLAVVLLALAVVAERRRPRELALGAGVLLYLSYVVKVGGDFMSGRFLSSAFLVAVVLLMGALDSPWFRRAALGLALVLGCLAPFPTPASGADFGLRRSQGVDRQGIADERRFYFGGTGLLNGDTGWTRPAPSMAVRGRQLRTSGTRLTTEGNVGVSGYFAGPGVHIIDYHALTDPLLSRLPMVRSDPLYVEFAGALHGRPPDRSWRVGHFLRNVPPGYLASLASGVNRLSDPAVAKLYDDVALATRAGLLSRGRLGAIVRLNLGAHGEPGRTRPEYRAADWSEVSSLRAGDAEAHYQHGQVLYREGQNGEALAAFARAAELDPGHLAALLAASESSLWTGQLAQAEDFARRATVLAPAVPDARSMLARTLWAQRRFPQAADAFAQAAELEHSELPAALTKIGRVKLDSGDPAAAEVLLSRAVSLDPLATEALVSLGRARLAAGKPAEAMHPLKQALAIVPGERIATLSLAEAHLAAGNSAEAVRILEAHLRSKPGDAEALFRVGEILRSAGQSEAAIAHWQTAARIGYGRAKQALAALGLNW